MAMMAGSLVSKVLEILIQMTKDEFTMQMGFNDDVKELQRTLQTHRRILEDAEKKRIEDASTILWVNQIKDVMYDIEDVLEEYHALHLSRSDDHETHCQPKVVCCSILLPFKKAASKHTIGVQIAELNKTLIGIMSQIPTLQFMETLSDIDANQEAHNQLVDRMTHSLVVHTDIVGLQVQDDVWRLVDMLTKEDDRDNPLVCAIVGMGGIGKTTRAKLVFDDGTIKNYFELTVWVSVSKNYDLLNILRSIIGSASGVDERSNDLNLLCDKVKVSLQGKRLFMVLDDVWETETETVWKGLLRSLLKSGAAKGSKVLVTTRNREVANQMMSIHDFQVEPLPLEDGWSLLCKSAFPDWQQHEAKNDVWNLKDIGMELVKKCDGLPLAINVIGGMLSSESRTREAWELVLKSSAWEVNGLLKEIHSALYLSYQSLPPNIKQCFLYCSLLPKHHYFDSRVVETLWIQEGLIKKDTFMAMYEVAKSYIWILLQRNLLILKPDKHTVISQLLIMHDLVYSLTQFILQNENLVATEEAILNNKFIGGTVKLRRLSFVGGGVKTMNILPKNLEEQVSLRTLLIFDNSICKIDNDLLNHLRRLRILMLAHSNVSSLPDSLGSLKLLRYINLSNTPVRELPETIKNLKNLRALDVSHCVNLYNLPSCVMKLHLMVSLCTDGSGLTHLPPGLGKLNKLQTLDFTVPSEEVMPKSSTMKELGTLTELRQLVLCKLEMVLDRTQAKSTMLKEKTHLQKLMLVCSESDSNQVQINHTQVKEAADKIEEIFEDLCPPPQLRLLWIDSYYGFKLPNWLGHSSFNSLSNLLIDECKHFNQLNGLGLLPQLELLGISGASSIKSIRPAFYTGTDKSSVNEGALFPRLKILFFHRMFDWEEWSSSGEVNLMMPLLEDLTITSCPKLKSFPRELLHHAASSLKKIRIYNCGELLLEEVQELPHLELLVLHNIPKLKSISQLPELQEISIVDCPGIKSVKLNHRLHSVAWEDFNADSLPEWFLTKDEYGEDNKLKAFFLAIVCKEELVRKIRLKGQNEADEMSKIFEHFNRISFRNEECLRLNYTENLRSFVLCPIEEPVDMILSTRLPLFSPASEPF